MLPIIPCLDFRGYVVCFFRIFIYLPKHYCSCNYPKWLYLTFFYFIIDDDELAGCTVIEEDICLNCVTILKLLLSFQAQQTVLGPSSTTSDSPKVTFPAYTQPSSTPSVVASSSTVAKPPATVTSKPATLTTLSATSKLMHPDEDISLVSA